MIFRLAKLALALIWDAIRAIPAFIKDYFSLTAALRAQPKYGHQFPIQGFFPALSDRFAESGHLLKHYFQQDLFVARRIFENNPQKHLDIGSRIDGFVAHVAAFRPIEILDIRPLDKQLPNITFRQADLMKMPQDLTHSCDSISTLHAIEHFGLGRYGDPIDVAGHEKALENIYTILKPGGTLYFSSPIGPQRIVYNAHRVFSVDYLLSLFEEKYTVRQFSYIDDAENFFINVDLSPAQAETNFGCTFGCGIFELVKV